LPNYTGSTGYGGKHVDALIGKCGERDVADIVRSVKAVIDSGASGQKVAKYYYGGSHGGFLGAHRKTCLL